MWSVIICCRVCNVEWVEWIVIGMIVTCELFLLLTFRTYCVVDVDCQSVSVAVELNVIRALNFLIYMTLKMQSLCHCGHQDLTYYQMMSYSDCDIYALIRDNSMNYNHRVHMNVFSLKKKK